jgi:D-sedoheptulose 7-phosphate isomerase
MAIEEAQDQSSMHAFSPFQTAHAEALRVLDSLRSLEEEIHAAAALCLASLKKGRKLVLCGNGGSAADAQHLVGELMGRYRGNRRSWPAVALNADSVTMSCIGNDYSFEEIYARQAEALCQPGDVLIVFSTSGNSPNILRILETAHRLSIRSIGFFGNGGGNAGQLTDIAIIVAHKDTARIQEGHQFLLHALMDAMEPELANF